MKITIAFITILLSISMTGKALVKVANMSEITRPVDILVDADQIYIVYR